jgi:electron transport complex protein RnfB
MRSESAADLSARIDALLPQTQCRRCGYDGCRPYAAAIARGEAEINQCPPGGSLTILKLAALLGRPAQPLNPLYGVEAPPRVAWIDESRCIGCARCLAPCPVDAILGAPKHMHTVLADRCTGCELCLPPCPVDCIELRQAAAPAAHQSALNRLRFEAHAARLDNQAAQRRREIDEKKRAAMARRTTDP